MTFLTNPNYNLHHNISLGTYLYRSFGSSNVFFMCLL